MDWNRIRLVVCYSNTNVKLIAAHGGITVGEDEASHKALEDIALMRALPYMTVVVPADAAENYPVIIRRIGIRDLFGCSGSHRELLRLYGLTPGDIVKTGGEALKK